MSEKKETAPALKKSWLKSIKAEFGKITWPSKKQLIKETVLVVIVAILLGLLICGVDYVIALGLSSIF